jgi:diadenosine tetraphosphate (Ap4A) HIT family hydrolase
MNECSFCDIEGFRADSTIVRENDLCLFANRDDGEGRDANLLRGSGIIVPKAHRPTVFDLSGDEIRATHELLLEVRPLLDDRYRPDGYCIGWNCYAASGQVVPHAHLHVLLRFADEPHAGKGIRWFFRQPDNLRPAPRRAGWGRRDFHDGS